MDEVEALWKHIQALENEGSDLTHNREHARALREGLDHLSAQVAQLQKERNALHARRESLETQVMNMIDELEASESAWDNVLHFEDFDPSGGAAA